MRGQRRGMQEKAERHRALAGEGWEKCEAFKRDVLEGKVSVLDLRATWSGPSDRAVPKNNALLDKYRKDGLVIIGICSTLGGDAIAKAVEANGISYPVCVDIENRTNTAYAPNGYPDYYISDRAGKLRIADCTNASLEDAVKALLSETPEEEGEGEEAEEAASE